MKRDLHRHMARIATLVAVLALPGLLVERTAAPACAAPKSNPEPDFIISFWLGSKGPDRSWGYQGSFSAAGAITDAGSAIHYGSIYDEHGRLVGELVVLSGEYGDIEILMDVRRRNSRAPRRETSQPWSIDGSFCVLGGTGAYADLDASGNVTGDGKIGWGWFPYRYEEYQLEGFLGL